MDPKSVHVDHVDHWVLKPAANHPGKFYYYNKITRERSWDVPACLTENAAANPTKTCDSDSNRMPVLLRSDVRNTGHHSVDSTVGSGSVSASSTECNTRSFSPDTKLDVDESLDWKLHVVSGEFNSTNNSKDQKPTSIYSKKIVSFYEKNRGVTFDFSKIITCSTKDQSSRNMSNKRRAEQDRPELLLRDDGTEQSPAQVRSKRRRKCAAPSPGDDHQLPISLSKEEIELIQTLRKKRQPPKDVIRHLSNPHDEECFNRSPLTKSVYSLEEDTRDARIRDKGQKFTSSGYSQDVSSNIQSSKASTANRNLPRLSADERREEIPPPHTPKQRYTSSASATATSGSSKIPKAWSSGTKVNSAEKRLKFLQEKLKQEQKLNADKDGNFSRSTSFANSSASLNIRLVGETLQQTNPQRIKVDKLEDISSLPKVNPPLPVDPTKTRFNTYTEQEKPVEVHAGKKPETGDNKSHIGVSPTMRRPTKETERSWSQAKDLAVKRLASIKKKNRKDQPLLVAPNLPPQKYAAIKVPPQTSFGSQQATNVTVSDKNIYSQPVSPSDGSMEAGEENLEEAMDWEPSDQQINTMILSIQEVRNQMVVSDLIPAQPSTDETIVASSVKSKFFIVLDSNILIGHLKLVEALRDRQYKALEPLVLIIPWAVIQELDKLKCGNRSPKKTKGGHCALTTSMARMAVTWINKQLSAKHPRVKGQMSFDRIGPQILCRTADDTILACCKEMEPFATNVVLLTEDMNLRNKALMLDIQVKSQSEIKTKLVELTKQSPSRTSSRPRASGSGSVSSQEASAAFRSNELDDNVISREESGKSDLVLCEVKLILRDYLEEVVRSEMQKVYEDKWASIVKVNPPWLVLSEVVHIFILHWRSVFGFVYDRRLIKQFEELYEFLSARDIKAYNHSLAEVHRFITTCIGIVRASPKQPNGDSQAECLETLKKCQLQCKKPAAARIYDETRVKDTKIQIEKPLDNLWRTLRIFCYLGCEFFQIKHNILLPDDIQNAPKTASAQLISETLISLYKVFNTLISSLNAVIEIPPEQLTANNRFVQDLHKTLTQLSLENGSVDEYPSARSLAAYCAEEDNRRNIRASVEQFLFYNNYLTLFRTCLEQR